MKVFITGVSGFVGTGLVKYLQAVEGISLYAHSRNMEAAKENFKNLKVEMVPRQSAEMYNEFGIDCIIHLAGIAHDISNKYRHEDYYKVNFEGTKLIFDEFVKSTASKFIFLSSIKACIDTSPTPVFEDIVPLPVSDYGKSKLMAEKYMSEQKLVGKSVYVFRPCMIHGRGNKGNLNALFKYVKSGMPYIFGAYSNQRSFLSAENLNFIILQFLQNSYPSGVYHLADDEPLPVTELIKIISSSLGRKPRIWNIPVSLLDPLSKMISLFRIPSERIKQKLTENMVVSNAKLRSVLRKPLPLDSKTGLLHTLRSFNE